MRGGRSGAGGGCGAGEGLAAGARPSDGGASPAGVVRGRDARRIRRWTRWALLLALPLGGGCGEEAPRTTLDAGGADASARSADIPPGSASLPPSAGITIPDSLETGRATPSAGPGEAHGPVQEPAAREPDGQETSAPEAVADAEEARGVVRDYYAAIAAGNYERAYGLWEDGGRRSGQTFLEFAAGFAGTERVRVQAGAPARVEGAAGSRYVQVPVVVEATTRSGRRERFEGTYTLRRSVVDGATEAQRSWRLYDAEVQRVR